MESRQESFIQNIRDALCTSALDAGDREAALFTRSSGRVRDRQARIAAVESRDRQARLALLDRLIEEGKPLNLSVIPKKTAAEVSAAIAELVANTEPEWGGAKRIAQWDHPLVRELDLAAALKDQDVPVFTAAYTGDEADDAERAARRQEIRQEVTGAYIGVTSADYCLTDTATLVMKSRPSEARSVSLLPSIHVAVIRLEQILFDLKELYALLDPSALPHHMVFISGPSKTADIELVMVHGAHGPRALYLYVITD